MKWKTKDGRVIEASKMETSHLTNVISYLQKKLDHYYKINEAMESVPESICFNPSFIDTSEIEGYISEFDKELAKRMNVEDR